MAFQATFRMTPEEAQRCSRYGSQIKRLVGDSVFRYRIQSKTELFNIKDDSPMRVWELCKDEFMLQLSSSELHCLVCDVDTLHPFPGKDKSSFIASSLPFSSERLRCATRILNAMLWSNFGITMHFFSSAKQGVHGWAFGHVYTREVRKAVSTLLPSGCPQSAKTCSDRCASLREWFERTQEYHTDAVKEVVSECMALVSTLNLTNCSDAEWKARIESAMAPNATHAQKLCALTAFYDVGVTASNAIRIPCAFNDKNSKYGFPLPFPTLDSDSEAARVWGSLVGSSSKIPTERDIQILESIPMYTQDEIRMLGIMAREYMEDYKRGSAKRNHPEDTDDEGTEVGESAATLLQYPLKRSLPADDRKRKALMPSLIREMGSADCIRMLERGIEEGGPPPCDWAPEPMSLLRLNAYSRHSFGNGPDFESGLNLPISLACLCGLDVPQDVRFAVARTMIASDFPCDWYAAAMMKCKKGQVRMHDHWASFFHSYANGNGVDDAFVWKHHLGKWEAMNARHPIVELRCFRANLILKGANIEQVMALPLDVESPNEWDLGFLSRNGTKVEAPTFKKTGLAKGSGQHNRVYTGATCWIRIDMTKSEIMKQVKLELESRDSSVEEAEKGKTRKELLDSWIKHASDTVDHMMANLDPKTKRLLMKEFIDSGGRYSYEFAKTGYAGTKQSLVQLRRVILRSQNAWTADVKRCHISMLLGCYQLGARAGVVEPNPLLERLCTDLEGVEAELGSDQARLLGPAEETLKRMQSNPTTTTPDALTNQEKFVKYLKAPAKTLLSAFLNHPANSPMFQHRWPLASQCCRALGAAGSAARTHTLVVTDPWRPELRGHAFRAGTQKERQGIACILERHCLHAMRMLFVQRDINTSLTINDEVIWYPRPDMTSDACAALESELVSAIEARVGFRVNVKLKRF